MFAQVKIGFFRGLGFCIALLIAFGIAYAVMMASFNNMMTDLEEGDYTVYSEDEKPSVKLQSYDVSGNKVTVLGVIDNQAEKHWEQTSVEVEFYLGEQFVRECTHLVETAIKPNSTEHFQMNCKSCGDGFPEFDRVEMKIYDSWIKY